jgi:hypothetical protein
MPELDMAYTIEAYNQPPGMVRRKQREMQCKYYKVK